MDDVEDVINISKKDRILCLAKYEMALYRAVAKRSEEIKLLKIGTNICQLLLKIPERDKAKEIAKWRIDAILNFEKSIDSEIAGEKESSKKHYEDGEKNFQKYLSIINNYSIKNE